MRSGFVSIVGRPNVGKSTLLNCLINRKLAITSDKVGTTRNIIYGVYNEEDVQIVFVDTPGIGKANNKLEHSLNKKSYSAMENDIVLFLVDIASGFGKNDNKILERLKQEKKEVILVLNKIDKISKDVLFERILELKDLYDFLDIVPISSLKKDNINELLKVIKKYLKDDIKYFDDEIVTNVTEKFMVSEIIREKVLLLTKEEVPHSVTCVVEDMDFQKGSVYITALIIVDRDNLKSIIIGKRGSMLTKIGSMARVDIEELLNKKVYLKLYVKTIENWREKENIFEYLGISELDS